MDSLELEAQGAATVMLDPRARRDRQDPAVRREKWDKECTDRKGERGNLVPLVPREIPDPLSTGTATERQLFRGTKASRVLPAMAVKWGIMALSG